MRYSECCYCPNFKPASGECRFYRAKIEKMNYPTLSDGASTQAWLWAGSHTAPAKGI